MLRIRLPRIGRGLYGDYPCLGGFRLEESAGWGPVQPHTPKLAGGQVQWTVADRRGPCQVGGAALEQHSVQNPDASRREGVVASGAETSAEGHQATCGPRLCGLSVGIRLKVGEARPIAVPAAR